MAKERARAMNISEYERSMPVVMLGLESTATAIGMSRLAAAVLEIKLDKM